MLHGFGIIDLLEAVENVKTSQGSLEAQQSKDYENLCSIIETIAAYSNDQDFMDRFMARMPPMWEYSSDALGLTLLRSPILNQLLSLSNQ